MVEGGRNLENQPIFDAAPEVARQPEPLVGQAEITPPATDQGQEPMEIAPATPEQVAAAESVVAQPDPAARSSRIESINTNASPDQIQAQLNQVFDNASRSNE